MVMCFMAQTPSLKAAHALQGRNDVLDLYGAWADTYDTGFAMDQGYQIPREVALAYQEIGGQGPVLDVGAGTGLVAEEMVKLDIGPVDGVDLSPDMLRVAEAKAVYRRLIEADVTKALPGAPTYTGIVSSGTFTLGHVGPEGITALLDGAAPDTQFVISVNARHYESAGFAALLDDLKGQIADLTFKDIKIYDDRCDPEYRDEVARLLIFRSV